MLTSCIKGHPSRAVVFLLLGALTFAQEQRYPSRPEDEPKRLPDGRLQSELMLKQAHQDNIADMDQMRRLLEVVREELDKNDRHVLSLKSLKNLEEIEKLSKRVRDRMKRF